MSRQRGNEVFWHFGRQGALSSNVPLSFAVSIFDALGFSEAEAKTIVAAADAEHDGAVNFAKILEWTHADNVVGKDVLGHAAETATAASSRVHTGFWHFYDSKNDSPEDDEYTSETRETRTYLKDEYTSETRETRTYLKVYGDFELGCKVQLLVKEKMSTTWEFDRIWSDASESEAAFCAEGTLIQNVGSMLKTTSISMSLNKILHMSRDEYCGVDWKIDCWEDPWYTVANLQDPWYELDRLFKGTPLILVNPRESSFRLNLLHAQVGHDWTFHDQVTHGDTVERLFSKWNAAQQFLDEKHEFYFIFAEKLRGHQGALPRFQELVCLDGWLEKKTLSIQDVVGQTFAKSTVTVSHTWFASDNPFDPENKKISALIRYLNENCQVQHVWIDYACLPQEKRSVEERQLFDSTLPFISLLYLGTKVLRIVTSVYFERFWPQFESYLSNQSIHKYGFQSEHGTRCSTICIDGHEGDYAQHLAFYKNCTYEDAWVRLSDENVKVTSQKDKDICLEKLKELKEFMALIFNSLRTWPREKGGQRGL